jgi:hypothetical protein
MERLVTNSNALETPVVIFMENEHKFESHQG